MHTTTAAPIAALTALASLFLSLVGLVSGAWHPTEYGGADHGLDQEVRISVAKTMTVDGWSMSEASPTSALVLVDLTMLAHRQSLVVRTERYALLIDGVAHEPSVVVSDVLNLARYGRGVGEQAPIGRPYEAVLAFLVPAAFHEAVLTYSGEESDVGFDLHDSESIVRAAAAQLRDDPAAPLVARAGSSPAHVLPLSPHHPTRLYPPPRGPSLVGVPYRRGGFATHGT